MTPRHLCVLTIHFARLIFTRFSSAAVGRKQANLVHSSFTSAAVGEEANLIALDMHYPVNNNIQLKISLGSHFCSSSHLSMGCIHKQKNPSQEPCTHAQSFQAGSPRALTDEAVAMRAFIFPTAGKLLVLPFSNNSTVSPPKHHCDEEAKPSTMLSSFLELHGVQEIELAIVSSTHHSIQSLGWSMSRDLVEAGSQIRTKSRNIPSESGSRGWSRRNPKGHNDDPATGVCFLGSVQQQIGVFECGNGLCRMELG